MKTRMILMGICGIALCFGAPSMAQISLKQVKPAPGKVYQAPQKVDYQTPLSLASEIHKLITDLPRIKLNQEKAKREAQHAYQDEQRMKALEQCNIQRLSSYFKDPAAVWNKLTEQYDVNEKDMAVYLNSSIAAPKEQTPEETADQEMTELFMFWSLGNNLLNDLYQNPEAWGEPKEKDSPVFPLWDDQKYLVDEAWNEHYNELNAFFGVPLQGRPLIGDEKYNYKQYEEVVLAHEAYLAMLGAAKPERLLVLPDRLKQPPEPAPKPLPPVDENVIYLKNQDGSIAFFPQMPEPWKAFQESGFKKYNPSGEMARDFIGKGFQLKESVAQRDPQLMNRNRLEVYQDVKKTMDGSKKSSQLAQERADQQSANYTWFLKRAGVTVPEEKLDLTNPGVYQDVLKQLKTKKAALLEQASQAIDAIEKTAQGTNAPSSASSENETNKKTPEHVVMYQQVQDAIRLSSLQKARRLVAALSLDEEGEVVWSEYNAGDVEVLLGQARARTALLEEAQNRRADYEEKSRKSKPIDPTCMNKGDLF